MARLRIKLELNPGGDGIRLDKLANISGELEKFLRSLATDCGVSTDVGEWVARGFYEGSMGAIVEHVGTVEPIAAERFNSGIRKFTSFRQDRDTLNGEYSETTYRTFVDIGSRLDTDEVVKIGLFDRDAFDSSIDPKALQPDEWESIAKRTTVEVQEAILSPVVYLGSIQGQLGTWYKPSDFIYVKDNIFGAWVKCIYKAEMYEMIHRYYKDRKAVVHVTGLIKSDRLTGQPKEVIVEKIDRFDRLSDDEFESLLGGAPTLIGEESSSDFIDRMRDDGDA